MNPGNTQLVPHGIQTEKADLRAHVCPLAKSVYIFSTSAGMEAIDPERHREVPVYTSGIQTATGYLVPPGDIDNCTAVELLDNTWNVVALRKEQTTSQKGKRAEWLVSSMIRRGKFPVSLTSTTVDDTEEQISGSDIVISTTNATIQVKCDFAGGGTRGVNGCTGNLFLQIAECNPDRQY